VDYTDLLYTSAGGVATITINRPDRYNAFRLKTVEELIHAFEAADAEVDVGVIVLTGTGDKAFCTGGDVAGEAEFTPHNAWMFNRRLLNLSTIMRNTGKPIIARINGWCIGGGNELNMLCDLSIASDRAKFGQAGSRVGSVPIWYGTQMLPRVVGEKRAREIVMLCHGTLRPTPSAWVGSTASWLTSAGRSGGGVVRGAAAEEPDGAAGLQTQPQLRSDTLYPSVVHGYRLLNLRLNLGSKGGRVPEEAKGGIRSIRWWSWCCQ
jgi:naphthoate synthase/2-ketocyclohexanecarboxyl-CoA hydrolase